VDIRGLRLNDTKQTPFLGDVFAAHRLCAAPAGTRTAAAHAYGFTDTELAQAATLLGHTAPAAGRG